QRRSNMRFRTRYCVIVAIVGVVLAMGVAGPRTIAAETTSAAISTNASNEMIAAVTAGGEADKGEVFSPWFILGPSLRGNVTAKGHTEDVSLDFNDIYDHTEGGFQAYIELSKQRFGFYAYPTYLHLNAKDKSGNNKIEFDQKFWVAEFAGFYRVGIWDK